MTGLDASAVIDLSELDGLLSQSSLATPAGSRATESVDLAREISAAMVRELAARGELTNAASTLDGATRRRLVGAAYEIVAPVVFERLTRTVESRRGHAHCAHSVTALEPECLDRFHDDTEAVLDDLLSNANNPIHNLESWVASRLTAATVDAHRRRRGQRGALQRPRLPGWLAEALGSDRWLRRLAVELLTWVGLPVATNDGPWPIEHWMELRQSVTGHVTTDGGVVECDLNTVLDAMRKRSRWYERYVERPLGRKKVPVAAREPVSDDADQDRLIIKDAEEHDRRLVLRAAAALDTMTALIGSGESVDVAVRRALVALLTAEPSTFAVSRRPYDSMVEDDHVLALVADHHEMDLLVRRVLAIIDPDRLLSEQDSTRTSVDGGPREKDAERPTGFPDALMGVEVLAERERDVAVLVLAGHTNREIGERLGVSPHTVHYHLLQIYRKFDVRSRVQLAVALEAGAGLRPDRGPPW